MSWIRETSPEGLPVWRGRDSIVNVHQGQAQVNLGCGLPVTAVLVIIGLIMAAAGGGGAGSYLGMLVLLIGVPAGVIFMRGAKGGGLSVRTFFNEDWVLWEARTADFHGLHFLRRAGAHRPEETWAASLTDIARVETGMTKQWIGSRTLGQTIHPVTDFESQTFLFMNDGSRRVICSANANQEVTATLAHSVRTWLEEKRDAAHGTRSSGGEGLSVDKPEGFDI